MLGSGGIGQSGLHFETGHNSGGVRHCLGAKISHKGTSGRLKLVRPANCGIHEVDQWLAVGHRVTECCGVCGGRGFGRLVGVAAQTEHLSVGGASIEALALD